MTAEGIVVGLDGSHASENALLWAGCEAERRGAELYIAHATDLGDGIGLSSATRQAVLRDSAAYGRQLVKAARELIAQRFPAVLVHCRVEETRPEQLLIELSNTASMVVVGTEGDNRFMDMVLGSVSRRVAAHAGCPVVVIGRGWLPTEPHGEVMVGVADSAGGRAALRFGFAEAAQRNATLVAVRAYGVFGRSDSAEVFAPLPGLRYHESTVLHEVLDEVRGDFPQVTVRPVLIDEPVTDALPRLSAEADLLVLGCRHGDHHRASRLGGIASTILHRSLCPVAVIDVPTAVAPEAGGIAFTNAAR
jgi:nucleotide-binding universal stress UspA family protein